MLFYSELLALAFTFYIKFECVQKKILSFAIFELLSLYSEVPSYNYLQKTYNNRNKQVQHMWFSFLIWYTRELCVEQMADSFKGGFEGMFMGFLQYFLCNVIFFKHLFYFQTTKTLKLFINDQNNLNKFIDIVN